MNTSNLEHYRRDRRLSVTREGCDPDRFKFTNSVQGIIRHEKRAYVRSLRRSARAEIQDQLQLN
jgi:hypothetical protein